MSACAEGTMRADEVHWPINNDQQTSFQCSVAEWSGFYFSLTKFALISASFELGKMQFPDSAQCGWLSWSRHSESIYLKTDFWGCVSETQWKISEIRKNQTSNNLFWYHFLLAFLGAQTSNSLDYNAMKLSAPSTYKHHPNMKPDWITFYLLLPAIMVLLMVTKLDQ